MKIAVALCFLAIFYTVDANLEILRTGVKKSKTTIQNTVQKLERLQRNTKQHTIMKVKNKQFEEIQRYNGYNNLVLDAIRKEVAKAEGKNAQLCYNTTFNTLRNMRIIVTNDAERCVDTAKSFVKSELNFIDNFILTGHKLITKLDSIFPSCYSNDIFKMQSCIAIELGQTNILVKNFENDSKSAENIARSTSNTVFLQGSKCLSDVYLPTRLKITEANLAATKCLKNL